MAHATDEDMATRKHLASLSLREPSPKHPYATNDGSQGLLSSVPTGLSLVRSMASGCEDGADEESFVGDGPCMKPAGAKGLCTMDGCCMVEADAIIMA